MARTYKQGFYTPKNPDKYLGDPNRIIFRSSWELEACKFFDNNPNILKWGSEEVSIPYVKPTDQRVHKYYVDFVIQYKDKNGDVKIDLIEVKPINQVRPPKKSKGKKQSVYMNECITYSINQAKWHAASLFAQQRGWTFKLLTEQQMFNG